MLVVGAACAGRTKLGERPDPGDPCSRRGARSLVLRVVIARGEERFTGKAMVAYRRPEWVRGELYDPVGTPRGSFLLTGDRLALQLPGAGEVIEETPSWDGWDGLLGIPEGSSGLFPLLPMLLDPWAAAGDSDGSIVEVATSAGEQVTLTFEGTNPTGLTVVDEGRERVVCSFEGGDGCLAAEEYTVDLIHDGVVMWMTVEADGAFPDLDHADHLPEQ
jgi:hypothetical protein